MTRRSCPRSLSGYTVLRRPATIPFSRGAEEIVEFYAQNPTFEPTDPTIDALMDRLVERFSV